MLDSDKLIIHRINNISFILFVRRPLCELPGPGNMVCAVSYIFHQKESVWDKARNQLRATLREATFAELLKEDS